MAEGVFELDVLRILLSEFDKNQKQTRSDIIVSECVGDMSVVIMGAEHARDIGLIMCHRTYVFSHLGAQEKK